MIWAGLLGTVVLNGGCGRSETSPAVAIDEAFTNGIISGREVEMDETIATSTVGIGNTKTGFVCTGSILSESLIITAAHCVEGSPDDTKIVFGLELNGRERQVRDIVAFTQHPLWETRQNAKADQADIAVILFAGGLPRGYQKARLLADLRQLKEGAPVTIAGYGRSNAKYSGEKTSGTGRLRKKEVTIESVRKAKSEILVNQTEDGGACTGDSGGPAYFRAKNGQELLWGVSSRVIGPEVEPCSKFSVYTVIPIHRKWLEQAARELRSQNPKSQGKNRSIAVR